HGDGERLFASTDAGADEPDAGACAPGLARAPRDGWRSLALSGRRGCAVHASGRVGCWGGDAIGRGTEWLECAGPAWVDGVADVASIVGGGLNAVCARTKKSETFCWGYGPWAAKGSFVPVRAPHLDAMQALSMGRK